MKSLMNFQELMLKLCFRVFARDENLPSYKNITVLNTNYFSNLCLYYSFVYVFIVTKREKLYGCSKRVYRFF
jgi:hypothetical protein